MKLGIIGLPGSGRATLFEALTRQAAETAAHGGDRLAVVRVPDERVDRLSAIFRPRKTLYATIAVFLPGAERQKKEGGPGHAVKDCDALLHVVRNHGPDRRPLEDFRALDQELMLADLLQVEKRLERLEADRRRGRPGPAEEFEALASCRALLEAETPLRREPRLASTRVLRGFGLLSAKPTLVVFNNEDTDAELPPLGALGEHERCLALRGKLEQELARLSEEELAEFLEAYRIPASAMDRLIRAAYEVLGLISFFTVGSDEVRAWTLRRGETALEAAGTIHSDLQKGFIRAEVIAAPELIAAGSLAEARRRGVLRLEGKTYVVEDGDVITIRFNV
ncbi:MAG: DUF933 domain-containing protein [Desulfobacterales bacterium]